MNEKVKKIWIDGDTLVRKAGEREADDYLHGSGFQAKLTAFIKARDARLAEEQNAKLKRVKKPVQANAKEEEAEPCV